MKVLLLVIISFCSLLQNAFSKKMIGQKFDCENTRTARTAGPISMKMKCGKAEGYVANKTPLDKVVIRITSVSGKTRDITLEKPQGTIRDYNVIYDSSSPPDPRIKLQKGESAEGIVYTLDQDVELTDLSGKNGKSIFQINRDKRFDFSNIQPPKKEDETKQEAHDDNSVVDQGARGCFISGEYSKMIINPFKITNKKKKALGLFGSGKKTCNVPKITLCSADYYCTGSSDSTTGTASCLANENGECPKSVLDCIYDKRVSSPVKQLLPFGMEKKTSIGSGVERE